MKKLTCKELGGSCDAELTGDSFEEIGKSSQEHVMEQVNNGDEGHIAAIDKMRNATPEEQQSMMAEFEKKYSEAPEV